MSPIRVSFKIHECVKLALQISLAVVVIKLQEDFKGFSIIESESVYLHLGVRINATPLVASARVFFANGYLAIRFKLQREICQTSFTRHVFLYLISE